jgi:outer membrane receptor protein involved in Fe transport
VAGLALTPPNQPSRSKLSPTFATIPAYQKVDASLGWLGNSMTATLYVENLFDTETYTYINPANFNSNRYGTLRPRTFGIRLSYRL